ncbi:MAG: hypothetical protein J0I87_10920 [Cellulomonas sp.]|nr:hypothetical protein [Cellulomonas sp.]
MPVPARQDPRWQALVEHPEAHTYSFLALRILMQRIARNSPLAPAARAAAFEEVQALFTKNERLVAADIQSIFG